MANLRLVPVNRADAATFSASSAVLPAANLQTLTKTAVWRGAGTGATLTATFAGLTPLDSIGLMTSNLTAGAMWRARVFDGAALLSDSGSVLACPPDPLGELDFGYAPLGVNGFSFGRSAHSVMWLPTRYVGTSVQIDIDDPDNPSGYVEASRLVIGERWSPSKNFSWGSQLTPVELAKSSRAEDGTLRSEAGAKFNQLRLSLDWMTAADRRVFYAIAREIGLSKDFLISVYPDSSDTRLDSDYTLLAKFVGKSSIAAPRYGNYSAPVEIEEI